MEARIDIAKEEERLMSGLAKLDLNNSTNPKNTSKSLAEEECPQTNPQGIITTQNWEFEANIEKGDKQIKIFSRMKYSGSDEDKELSLSLLENALECYQNALKIYSYAPALYQIKDTQRLSYQIAMAERLRDFHLRPAFYRLGDSSLAYSNDYIQHAPPIMIEAFNKGLEILQILLERLVREEEEIQQEQEEKSKQKQSTRMQLPASGQQYLANTVSSTTKEMLSYFQASKPIYTNFTKEQLDAFEAYTNRVKSFSMQQEQYETGLDNALVDSDITYLKQQYYRLSHQIEYLDQFKYLNDVSPRGKTNTVVSSSASKRVRDNDNDDNSSPKTEIEKKKIKTQIDNIAPNNIAANTDNTSKQIGQYSPYNDDPEISNYSFYY